MFKLGRGGGGRGGGKRPLPQPSLSRPSPAPGPSRPPLGGGARGRPVSATAGGGAQQGKEESFSLSSEADLDFGAIIRLTPDLIEEIKRVEAQGGSARVKFAPNSTIPHGNVIDVGGKEFGFTWSRDELCDIYEERQSGEGGDGLLVECGSSWRKVNVLRTLDESTKKHVKKRSEEAERLLKSRKAIVLDPSNPSMKNQVKKMAAAGVEGSMRRMGWKQKKEVKEPFFKKQKVESNQVSNVCPPKSVYKSGAFSNRNAKGMLSVSPVPSPPEQPAPGSTVSPFATGTSSRGNAGLEEIVPLDINKEHVDIGNFEKELPSKIAHGAKHKVGKQKGCVGDQSVDLQSSHVRKASENSKGMALKALEKSSGEMVPNLATNNDSMVKNIEAPGKYLKSGVGAGSSKQREFESGSSPESAHDIASAIESIFGDNADEDFDRQAQPSSNTVEEDDPFEKIDIMNDNPDPFTNADKNIINDIEGKTSSSDSGSGSDSESDSSDSDSGSDSESQSRSRSKSRSPVGSASASSSDSDSDGSSTSKDVSDVDVDIMSEDEKQGLEPKAEAAYLKLSSSPRSRASDGEQEQIDILGVQEEQIASLPMDLNGRAVEMANPVEGAKNFPSSTSINTSENPEINDSRTIGSNLQRESSRFPGVALSPDRYKHSEDLHPQFVKLSSNINDEVIKKAVSEQQPKLDGFPAHAQTEIKKTKTKRDKPEYFKEKPESAKGSKGGRAAEGVPYGKSKHASLSVNSSYVSPEKTRQDQSKSNNIEWSGTKEADHQGHSLPDRGRSLAVGNMQKVHQGPEVWCSSGTGAEQPGPRSGDISERRKSMDRSNKTSERIPVRPDATLKDKTYKGTQDEVNIGEKLSILPEYNRKSVDHGGLNDSGPLLQIGKYDGNKSPLIGGKRSVLSRELSDLELGELREPSASGETGGVKRQTDGKKCFKSSESKAYSTDCPNPDISKGRSGSHLLPESMKHSPQSVRGEVHGNLEGFHRSMPSDDPAGTAPGPQRTILQGKHPSRVDHTDSEIKSHLDNPSELARRGETGANQGIGLENHADSLKRDPTSLPAQHSIKNGGQKGYKKAKELKQQKPSTLGHSAGQSNNGVSMENDSNSRKRRESSSELDLRSGAKRSLSSPPIQYLALKSLDISSTRPHQILVGGSDAFARLYDRRMLPPLSSCRTKMKPSPCISYFCPMHLSERRRSSLHLTHVTFSPNGEEVLLSYSGEHVYLMDVNFGNQSIGYTADDVPMQIYLSPTSKESEGSSPPSASSTYFTASKNNLRRFVMYKKLVQAAEKILNEGSNFLYGIEACNEVLDGKGPEIGNALRHECLCIRAALLLKRKWKNDAHMAIRDCNIARRIAPSSFKAHYYMSKALSQLRKHKEALDYAMAAHNIAPSNPEASERMLNIKADIAAAEAEKHKDNGGTRRQGRIRSLSDLLFRSEESQERPFDREDSDYDGEMEFDLEASVSGDEDHDTESPILRRSLNLRFHRSDDPSKENCKTNGSQGSPPSLSHENSTSQTEVAIDLKQRYVGHCNVGTDIKQASFLGQQGQFVASGSDDGRWFIWEKKTGRLIKMLAGDDAVVNCVQCHPFDCAVATSGIDNTIKIWTPHAEVPSMVAGGTAGPETADVVSVVESNQRKLRRNRDAILPLEILEPLRMHEVEFAEGTLQPFECAQS